MSVARREARATTFALAGLLTLCPASLAQQVGPRVESGDDLRRLRGELHTLSAALEQRDKTLSAMQAELAKAGADLAAMRANLRELAALPVTANAFLVSPPQGADALGVAKAMLFEPRLQLESARRHDTLFVKLRRIEPDTIVLLADLELGASDSLLTLPIDRNGALYAVEWSTEEGFTFTLSLQDGASEQTAASVQVRPLLNRGRFLFVGARLE